MQHVTTPTKADDGIEKIKRSISAEWGLRFSPRESTWSPSTKSGNDVTEDKVHSTLRYLFWQKGHYEGALEFALAQFWRQAPSVKSKWVFKPKGEADVIPSKPIKDSELQNDFLHTRAALNDEAQNQLMDCLLQKLSQVAERVKSGQSYVQAPGVLVSVETVQRDGVEKFVKPETPQDMISSRSASRSQARLDRWFRTNSAPNPQSSIDEYSDTDVDNFFKDGNKDVAMPDAPTLAPFSTVLEPPANHSPQSSPGTEEFKTPPLSPIVSPLQPVNKTGFKIPQIPGTRKRSHNEDPLKAAQPRKSSRENSKRRTGTLEHRSFSDSFTKDTPSSSFRSETTSTSFSVSTTATSSAFTSPNTSFSTGYSGDSRKTSFEFSSDTDTDTTVRALMDNDHHEGQRIVASPLQKTVPEGASPERDGQSEGMQKISADQDNKKSEKAILDSLHSYSPFGGDMSQQHLQIPFRQLYEVLRVSLSSRIDLSAFTSALRAECTDYDKLWIALCTIVRSKGATMPARSDLKAWKQAASAPKDIAFGGKLEFDGEKNGPLLRLTLSALKQEPSHRLMRKFGSDRFMTIRFPAVDSRTLPKKLKAPRETIYKALMDWLVYTQHSLLGRKWQVYYGREDRSQKASRTIGKVKDRAFRIHLFAEDGYGFGPQVGEPDPRRPEHKAMSALDMIQWFMPAECNSNQSALKLFARLQLAVSKTIPTVTFKRHQVFRVDDAYADNSKPRRVDCERSRIKKNTLPSTNPIPDPPVMNDGCSRISRRAARAIADHLGLEGIPGAFQGRISGAKGTWMVDTTDEVLPEPTGEFWIEISDSQLKFEGHRSDLLFPESGRITFEVNDYVKRLLPSSLNFQLMPILEHGGVPPQVFKDILQEDLTTKICNLQAAMDSGLALRLWNQRNSAPEERSQWAEMRVQGGLPDSTPEKINWFVDHGFEPKSCMFLRNLLFQSIKAYCQRLEAKLDVGIGQSTFPYMLADPLGVLDENEVHICFSGSFSDPKSGFDDTMLHDRDVLVARLPAHLPSDIQKVQAVFKPELRAYRDVIIFPVKGSMPLASKLSGGDYDGDRAWVCWDQKIVAPFRNTDLSQQPLLETFGLVKDSKRVSDFMEKNQLTTDFIRHGCDFNMRISMLGTCSLYHEAFCYGGVPIDSPQAIEIAHLLGFLVDSAKGGFIYDEAKWAAYVKSKDLKQSLRKPAYKNVQHGKPTKHLIDCLVFDVAKGVREKALGQFAEHFATVSPRDNDLSMLWKTETENAKIQPDVNAVLSALEKALEKIFAFWNLNCRPGRDDNEFFGNRSIQAGSGLSFQEILQHCRSEFLNLAPTVEDATIPVHSDRIRKWQSKHAKRQSSYWDLLKASAAFQKYYFSNFVWHMAGFELGEIKATAKGRGTYCVVDNEIYEALRVDGKFVEGIKRREDFEAMITAIEDDGDDYGSWNWESHLD